MGPTVSGRVGIRTPFVATVESGRLIPIDFGLVPIRIGMEAIRTGVSEPRPRMALWACGVPDPANSHEVVPAVGAGVA